MRSIAIRITPNNIFILASNLERKPIFVISSGQITPKLKGRKKVSTVAAKLLGILAAKRLKIKKCFSVIVYVLGNTRRRKTILAEFWKVGIKISEIVDITPLPHNGCKLRKIRRK